MGALRHIIFVLRYHGMLWRAVACLVVFLAIIVAMAVSLLLPTPAAAAEQPAPGMSCTYTKQTSAFGQPRTYGVEVVGYFEPAQDEALRPWLWIKRPGQPRYMSVLATAADLSECR